MFCVNVKSKEFKDACNRLNIHPSSLEVIVFEYLNNIDSNGFPSDSYIIEKLQGVQMTNASNEQIQLWEKVHSNPIVLKTAEQAAAKIKELSKYYTPESISSYRNNNGDYVIIVAEPINQEAIEKEIKGILANAPRNSEGQLLAPNGKPTKLTERQYAHVRTKAFKKWFGDWTKISQNEDGSWNIPNDVSKVIDTKTGEPKVVYHSSNVENINIYRPSLSKFGFGAGIFFSDNEEYSKFVTHTKFTYKLFLNIKNPINTNNLEREKTANLFLLEDPHSIQDWVEEFGTEEGYIEYFNSIKQRDGIIGEDAEKPSRYRGTVEYVVRNPNQIKSATDNVGTFSTESDNIRFNIQTKEEIYNVLDFLSKTLKDPNGVRLIHKYEGEYYISKTAFGGMSSVSVEEAYDKIQTQLEYALTRYNLPINLFNITQGRASRKITINEEALKDIISRSETLASLEKSFKSKEGYKKVKSILEFLANKTGLKYEIITQEKAKELLKSKKIDNVNAFVQRDTCYFIEGRQLNVDIATEEMLHPFVASIRQINSAAFKSLLKDAQRAFPRLRLEIARDYKGKAIEEIHEELVTQALSRAFREDIKNNPEGNSIKELIKNFINRIVEIFQSYFGENNSEVITEYKTRVDEILKREEIAAQDLQSTITINELAKIVNSGLKLYSPNIEGTRLNLESTEITSKTIDEQFMEDNQALISQIEDLGNIGLSSSEIKHLGEQLMWWISDHLTWLQNNPSKLEETYGIKKDASLMSREELASLITPSQLMTKCVEAFTKRQFKSLSQKSKVRKIANNWRALMFLSAKTFADIEGFGIIDSAAGFNVLQRIQTLTEDYNNDNDIDSITETVGDIQEHWRVEFRTIDVMNAMTPEIRLALLQCYLLDKDSNPIISEYGIKERIKPRQAVNTILRISQGQITVEGIIRKLEENRDQYPWFDQLIARLKDESGANSNFKSAFFSTFCKPFVAYSVVRKNPSTGNYESVIVNEFPALREAMNTITTQYKMRQHPMLGDTLNTDTFNAVKDIYTSLKDVKFEDINTEELIDKLTYVYNALGYYITPDLVSNILTEGNYKTIVENLGYIINNLTEGYTNNDGTYDPFKFGRNNRNIITSTRAIIKIITDTLEDTALSSTFDNGKMYQSYVTPSYLTKLMQKFTILSEEEFKKFMQEEYGQYEGWFTDSRGEYRLSWLRALNSSPEMRAIFKHKVQLNFNKRNYMRNMTDAEYTLSVISEFFAESDKAIGNYNVAWYRVPMLSNKPSSEFIKFIAHKGSFYKDTITDNMHDIFLQELSRIQTVRMRSKGKKDIDFIKNFDTNGAKFCFLDFFNEYLNGSQKNTPFGKLLNKKLEGKELTEEEKALLISESKQIIKEYMTTKAKEVIQKWKEQGIVEQCAKIKGINTSNIESELENFIWNDTLASMNIIQITVTDIAYYKDAEDLQKRFAQIHSPGVRGNNAARDFDNNPVTDGYHRTLYLADFEKVKSNIIENITIVFDRKIKEAEEAKHTTEVEYLKALKESLVGENGAYRDINVTDAQGYCCATSYRKKALIFGKWNKAKEEVYKRLMQGDYSTTDLEIAFQPLKPFVYSQIPKSSGVSNAPMGKLKTPIQNKNSEYLLLLAGAILQNEDTGKPNLLRAINEVMEESAEKSPTMGIDTIQFASAVKSSLTGVIDINNATNAEEAKERIRKAIYPDYKGDWKSYTPKVDYDERTVHKIPVEDYCIQQEVPPHFRDHDQAHGSQTRAIIIADLSEGTYTIKEGIVTKTVNREEFIKEYEQTIAANIEEDINALADELHLVGSSPAERNIAISRILQREILSNPNRYGTDLLVACSVDSDGNFRIPLGDPIQAKRVEQLLNSIIKNRISKQKLPGGPVVQVSNFGTSRQLSIVFKGKDGKSLRQRAKGESESSYKEYLQKNQAGIAYMECFAPAYTLDLFKNFMDEDGNVDIEAIEATDPELLKMVGYRIPTEDKYSIAPLKIVGFLPKEAGDGIMLPYDITLINGSDFDIDKMYLMRKTLPIRVKKDKEFTHHLQSEVFNKLLSKAKQSKERYNIEQLQKEAWDKVNLFFSDTSTEEKRKQLGEYYAILSKAYRKYRYETVIPKRDRDIRNNKIIDMTYEVMTHESTVDKMLNPGGFDQQKKMGYAVEAFRSLYTEEMSESTFLKLWEELQSKSIDELKELSYKDKNLCFIDTHIQFYKQNAAASTLIGVFAVHKVAHAILGNDGFRYNGIEHPFTIAGNTIANGISIDPERDFTEQYIGKVLGSLVASAADAVKDPILNLMNINNNTATVLCTMVRLGIPFDTAAMFLSQKSVAEILQKHAKESLSSPTSLNEIIKKELKTLETEETITENSEINTAELTREELIVGLVTDNKAIKYKVLKMLSSLLDISKDVKSLSYPTRFNSISNAVGPLIIDNLMMEYKLKKFPETITSRDEVKIDLEGLLARHPMLKQFHRTVRMAAHIFHDMPANSANFRDLLSNLPKNLKSRITSDRKLLSMLSDFYQSYMLVSSETIDSSKLMWYIDKYPAEFIKLLKEDESLKSNPLCAAIRLDVAKQSGRPILKIDTTGVDSDYKESLMSGWADLVKTHPNVAKNLFIYNFFRGGVVFNPQTFMGLVPYQVKENIEGYNESYSNPARIEPYIVIDQFIRNYSSNNQIVPIIKSLEGLNKLDKPVKLGDTVTIENSKDLSAIGESTYFKVKSGNSYMLFRVISNSKYSKVITRIDPLGNNGEYLELSTEEIRNSAEVSALSDSIEEIDNGIGDINGSDVETEEVITINDVTYTDETFTQFWSGKSEAEAKEFTKRLKGQSSAYLSKIVSILDGKGIKVTEEMQNKIKELYNLTC